MQRVWLDAHLFLIGCSPGFKAGLDGGLDELLQLLQAPHRPLPLLGREVQPHTPLPPPRVEVMPQGVKHLKHSSVMVSVVRPKASTFETQECHGQLDMTHDIHAPAAQEWYNQCGKIQSINT